MCLSKKNFSYHRSAFPVQTKYFSLQEQITSVQEKGNEYRIMSITNLSRSGTQTKTFGELLCSPSLEGGLQQESVSFAAVNIFLSITTFLGNSLILVALHKESSLHPPSKLLYRCLATTDLLVGLVAQPLHVCYLLDVCRSRTLEPLLLRRGSSLHHRRSIMWSFFADDDGNKRGQTSRPFVGVEIQRDCNFEAHLYHRSQLLGFMSCCLFRHHFR